MYIRTELDMHIGVHRPLVGVYKEPVNTLNNKYFYTYPKSHTVRPFLHNKVCKTATTLLRVEYAASIGYGPH